MTENGSALLETDLGAARSPLAASDRCDSCGAQAYVRVTLTSGPLLFCGHHAASYKDSLLASALAWHDETFRLSPTESPRED
jgi:hypothetical protein